MPVMSAGVKGSSGAIRQLKQHYMDEQTNKKEKTND